MWEVLNRPYQALKSSAPRYPYVHEPANPDPASVFAAAGKFAFHSDIKVIEKHVRKRRYKVFYIIDINLAISDSNPTSEIKFANDVLFPKD